MSAKLNVIITLVFLIFIVKFGNAQCNILDVSNKNKILKIENNIVVKYPELKKLYKFEGKYIVDLETSKKLASIEGNYIKNFPQCQRIAKVEGNAVIDFVSFKKVAIIECKAGGKAKMNAALAAAAFFLLE